MDNKGTVCKSSERIYTIYNAMMSRCYNPNVPHYFRYGGRGISVCDEWRNNYYSFREWAYESGYDENAPRGKCTIDRIDDDGNYCPENCRWVDMKVQNNNQHPAYTFMPRPSNSKHKRQSTERQNRLLSGVKNTALRCSLPHTALKRKA